jgi:hypothetical protein
MRANKCRETIIKERDAKANKDRENAVFVITVEDSADKWIELVCASNCVEAEQKLKATLVDGEHIVKCAVLGSCII